MKLKVTSGFRQGYDLFINLTRRDLVGKYKGTVFGQLWSLANPLALMVVYTFVFSFVIRIQLPVGAPSGLNVFSLWLLCGLLPWIFFSNVLNQGITIMVSNEALIKKVYFPRSVLVYSLVASLSVNWLIEMAVLVVAVLCFGAFSVLIYVPVLILFMALLALFACGIVLMLTIANVHFRDTQHFVAIALQLGMYLTPIVYPPSLVQAFSESAGPIIGGITIFDVYRLNPLYPFINSFRSLIYDNALPPLTDSVTAVLWSAVAIVAGMWVFNANEKKLAELL